jgi:hypothetical protein
MILAVLIPIEKTTSPLRLYLYIGGRKVGALFRADFMTNWWEDKYASLIALQNDAAKNSLWRSFICRKYSEVG